MPSRRQSMGGALTSSHRLLSPPGGRGRASLGGPARVATRSGSASRRHSVAGHAAPLSGGSSSRTQRYV